MRRGEMRITLMPFSKSSLMRLVSSIRSVKLLPPTDIPYTKAFSITFSHYYYCKVNEKNKVHKVVVHNFVNFHRNIVIRSSFS